MLVPRCRNSAVHRHFEPIHALPCMDIRAGATTGHAMLFCGTCDTLLRYSSDPALVPAALRLKHMARIIERAAHFYDNYVLLMMDSRLSCHTLCSLNAALVR